MAGSPGYYFAGYAESITVDATHRMRDEAMAHFAPNRVRCKKAVSRHLLPLSRKPQPSRLILGSGLYLMLVHFSTSIPDAIRRPLLENMGSRSRRRIIETVICYRDPDMLTPTI